MDLREQLERLRVLASSRPPVAAGTVAVTEPGAACNTVPIDAVVPGRWEEYSGLKVYLCETEYPLDHHHGAVPIRSCLEATPAALCWLARQETATPDLERTVFLDTETTGLAGGTGTYAFLVGLGTFRAGRFQVRQLFLPDFDAETALLEAFNVLVTGCTTIVTFNGKSFDWPLLTTRFVLSRLRPVLRDPVHIDLLHPARRLWQERLGDCTLASLERGVLGHHRRDDVPGYLIPGIYAQYLHTGNAAPLEPVFTHNRADILALAALTARLAALFEGREAQEVPAADRCALARIYWQLGRPGDAITSYETALAASLAPWARERAMLELSACYKRLQHDERAIDLWLSLVQNPAVRSIVPHVELAKHYEHRLRDPGTALQYALAAQALLQKNPRSSRQLAELGHRVARLQRKLARNVPTGA